MGLLCLHTTHQADGHATPRACCLAGLLTWMLSWHTYVSWCSCWARPSAASLQASSCPIMKTLCGSSLALWVECHLCWTWSLSTQGWVAGVALQASAVHVLCVNMHVGATDISRDQAITALCLARPRGGTC